MTKRLSQTYTWITLKHVNYTKQMKEDAKYNLTV